jgi:hypothetical protein
MEKILRLKSDMIDMLIIDKILFKAAIILV